MIGSWFELWKQRKNIQNFFKIFIRYCCCLPANHNYLFKSNNSFILEKLVFKDKKGLSEHNFIWANILTTILNKILNKTNISVTIKYNKYITSGIGSSPREMKNSSAFWNMIFGVQPWSFMAWLTSMLGFVGKGLSRVARLVQVCAHMLPNRWAGMGPMGSMTS